MITRFRYYRPGARMTSFWLLSGLIPASEHAKTGATLAKLRAVQTDIEEYWQGFQPQNIKMAKADDSSLSKKRERRPNVEKLWDVVKDLWPKNSQWQTIGDIKGLAPIGTAGIDNRSSYDFAMLTMLSTVRRNFVVHEKIITEKEINDEIVKTNRNNGIWRYHLNSRVRKAI